MNPLIHSKNLTVVLLVALACFGLLPAVPAVTPAPDGGYPYQNTAEGEDALFNLTLGLGRDNTAVGYHALFNNAQGYDNTAIGDAALSGQQYGSFNTAIGAGALLNSGNGGSNTATGAFALRNNAVGGANTATGTSALVNNYNGDNNTATGADALSHNTFGDNNTATGTEALLYNTTGSFNTAHGYQALAGNITGTNNTATGVNALGCEACYNTGNTGSFNTATGVDALANNTAGNRNTGNGVQALFRNTTGSKNSATGVNSLLSNTAGHDNVAIGPSALQNNTTGSFNIAVGSNAGASLTTGSDNIIIGPPGMMGESNTIRIGAPIRHTATFIAGIRGATTRNANAIPVVIDSAGQLGTQSSSRRFKTDIKPMNETSEAILSLKPVSFLYKSDKSDTPQFGLIAEEVAEVNPDLVVRDENGEIYTVRYEAVNAMLLNEFLKEHEKVERLEAALAAVNERLKAQGAKIDKVNAKVQLTMPAPQKVLNKQ